MKWSVDRKMIGNHDEITGAWIKWSGIMGRNRSLGEGGVFGKLLQTCVIWHRSVFVTG